jgi:hypothetical protein
MRFSGRGYDSASAIVGGGDRLVAIDWLRRGIPVERETCVFTSKDEAIAAEKSRAREVATRHPGQEPDGFRLIDAAF